MTSVLPIVGSGIFELCIFRHDKPDYVGYYDDVAAADRYIAEHQQTDIFLTPHRLNPSLIQRAHNQMVKANERTKDNEVLGYRYLLVDLDPRQQVDGKIVNRPKRVSATDAEHNAAISLARHIIGELRLKDENYMLIDSGNGAHIYIPIEAGVMEPAIKSALGGIKTLYETDEVEVDGAVFNQARLMRAPGSINCKGAIKRPCVYLHCPEHLMPMPYEFVKGLKIEEVHESAKSGEDLAEKIAGQLGYTTKKGSIYILKECPFCHSTDKAAVVGRVGADGGYFFKCHHNRCSSKKWSDLKEQVGLVTGRLDAARKVLNEQGVAALEDPEFQHEISRLKATGELHKLENTCREVGIEYKALQKAARKPFAIAQDMADEWIKTYHIKTDRITRDIYYYQNGIYVDATDFIAGLIDDKFRGINTTQFIGNVLDYIKRHSLHDFDDRWIGLENGLFDRQTLEVVAPSPDKVTRLKMNVGYDPTARCPKFLKFVEECKADEKLLQEAAGYPLLPNYPHSKAVMLVGSGGQGKSVFLTIVGEIYGSENISATPLQALIDNRFASSDLYGKLANIAGDIADLLVAETQTFKTLTGDDLVRAERKGQQAFKFWNQAKLLFSANAVPPSKDKTIGYMRRWVIIEFKREMVQNPNIHLAAELLVERSGIFNWMLEGAKRVRDQGFSYTNDPAEMARIYVNQSEPVVEFLEECCKENPDGFVSSQELANAYTAWATAKRKKMMSNKSFINAMKVQTVCWTEYQRKTETINKDEHTTESKRIMGFSGIILTKNTEQIKLEAKENKQKEQHSITETDGLSKKPSGSEGSETTCFPLGSSKKNRKKMVELSEKYMVWLPSLPEGPAPILSERAQNSDSILTAIAEAKGRAEENEAHANEQAKKYTKVKVRIVNPKGYRTQIPHPDNSFKYVDHLYNLGDILEVDANKARDLVERGIVENV